MLTLQNSANFIARQFAYCKSVTSHLIVHSLQFSRGHIVWISLYTQFMSSSSSLIPHFFRFSFEGPSPVHKRFSVLRTVHLLLCPGGKLFSTFCLLSTSHNFILLSEGYLLIFSCILGSSFLILLGNLQLVCYTLGAFHP